MKQKNAHISNASVSFIMQSSYCLSTIDIYLFRISGRYSKCIVS